MHDAVAQRAFQPTLPPVPEHVLEEEEEDSVKIVSLVKTKEPLVRGGVRVSRRQNGDLFLGRFPASPLETPALVAARPLMRSLIPLSILSIFLSKTWKREKIITSSSQRLFHW